MLKGVIPLTCSRRHGRVNPLPPPPPPSIPPKVLKAGTRTILPGARVPADQLPRADRDLVAVEKPNSIALRMALVAADEADLKQLV